MKILHTSDWHLGQNFMGQSREEEHKAFFSWLLEQIKEQYIDVLIVAGDIFDTGTPPNYALELYFNFLKKLSSISSLTTILTAGNHDSVTTLNAPKQLLKALNIHMITTGDKDENQLIPIYKKNRLQAIICAVPFLRDTVIRKSMSAESLTEKETLLNRGIKQHYMNIHKKALLLARNQNIPIVATGHLTTLGSKSSESERDIYIGGTLDIGSDFLGKMFNYVALGHLHKNQKVGVNHVRYSGSPLPLSFAEAQSIKKVNIVNINRHKVDINILNIPLYRPLLLLKGGLTHIKDELKKVTNKKTWIEVQIKDDNPFYANQMIRELAISLELTLLAVKINKSEQELHSKDFKVLYLDDLTVNEVFKKRLELENLESEDLKKELLLKFREVVEKVENR